VKNPKGPDSDKDGYIDSVSATTLEEGRDVSPMLMIGDSGLKRQGGWVQQEFLRDLRGEKGRKVYTQMANNDAICGSIMTAFSTLIRQVRWYVEPASETEIAKNSAKFVEQCLFEDMENSWTDFMSEVSTFFIYGFAPMEMVFKVRRGTDQKDPRYRSRYNDGKVGIRKLALRAQESIDKWDFTPGGDIRGLYQRTPSMGSVYIPRERLLLFRTEAVANNPEGKSLLRNAYRSYYFKERLEAIEAIGAERDLAGLPVLRIPAAYMTSDADDDRKAAFANYKTMVSQIVRDENEGLILPSDRDENGNLHIELELLGTGGTRQFDTTGIINRYNLAMATSVLADFILLGQRTVGSFALSDNKTDMFQSSLGTYLDTIQDQLQRRVLFTLWEHNGYDIKNMPKIQHEEVDSPTLEALGAYVKNLTDSGALGDIDKELINALRTPANLPPQVDELKLPPIHPSTAPKPEPAAGKPPAKKPADKEPAK
jgi:hypothetical protein